MPDIKIVIRSHNNRTSEASKLKKACESLLDYPCKILNTGEPSVLHNHIFVMMLYKEVCQTQEDYLLILEDDMLFSKTAASKLRCVTRRNVDVCWFSIPNSKVLSFAIKLVSGEYLLQSYDTFYYSGSILLKKQILKDYISSYLMNYMHFEYPEFDITMSHFLKLNMGHIRLAPGYFATNKQIESSFKGQQIQGRLEVLNDEIDPLFDFETIDTLFK